MAKSQIQQAAWARLLPPSSGLSCRQTSNSAGCLARSLPPSSGWSYRQTSSSAGFLARSLPSKLWLKLWPKRQVLQAAWQGHFLQALIEAMAKSQIQQAAWQGSPPSKLWLSQSPIVQVSAGCLVRWIGTNLDLVSSSADSLADEPSTHPQVRVGPLRCSRLGPPLPEQTLLLVLEALEESTMQDTNLLAHTYRPVVAVLPTIPCCSRLLGKAPNGASRCVQHNLGTCFAGKLCWNHLPHFASKHCLVNHQGYSFTCQTQHLKLYRFGCIHIGSHATPTPHSLNCTAARVDGTGSNTSAPRTWEAQKVVAGSTLFLFIPC